MTSLLLPQQRPLKLRKPKTTSLAFECVYLASFERDFNIAAQLLGPAGIRLHRAAILDQADFLLTVTGSGVLLSEFEFLDGSWKDASDMLSRCHPEVALVVSANQSDERFPIEILERGAHGLILKPFQADELRRILANAQRQC